MAARPFSPESPLVRYPRQQAIRREFDSLAGKSSQIGLLKISAGVLDDFL